LRVFPSEGRLSAGHTGGYFQYPTTGYFQPPISSQQRDLDSNNSFRWTLARGLLRDLDAFALSAATARLAVAFFKGLGIVALGRGLSADEANRNNAERNERIELMMISRHHFP